MALSFSERQIASARVEQIKRVNSKSVFEEMAEMRLQIEQLTTLLQAERAARQEAERTAEALRGMLAANGKHLVNGRPVLTVQEAAARVGVSIYTVYRYLKSGWWQGADEPTCCVYADQPLSKKRI